jgi:hypothetical protein
MSQVENWYVVKQPDGRCMVTEIGQLAQIEQHENAEKWGPYATQAEAIARRVGLIRAGKCTPS